MATFEIEFEGTPFEVEAPSREAAIAAIKRQAASISDRPGRWEAAGRAALDGLTFGFGDEIRGRISAIGDESYEDAVARHREREEMARADYPGTTMAAEFLGGLPTGLGAGFGAAKAAGRAGLRGAASLAGQMGYGALGGAAQGAAYAYGEDQNIAGGAAIGGALGAVAQPVANGISRAVGAGAQSMRLARATPKERASYKVFDAVRDIGEDQVRDEIGALGPDAMLIDALKKRGTSLARGASNVSPEAREVLEGALLGRKAGQNTRVASDIEAAAGLPTGSRASVDDLKEAAYNEAAGPISRAYTMARVRGADLPRAPFADVLMTPMGSRAYREAGDSLLNRSAAEGVNANSELARLDQTKRTLDAIGQAAGRKGRNDTAGEAKALAKVIRERLDETLVGPEYAKARELRQNAYAREEAFDSGATLAGRVPLGMPQKIASQADNRDAVAQGYAARQVEKILNRRSTEGALNGIDTPAGREAYEAALGEKAQMVTDGLARERAFNATARDVTGNSSTARQLLENGMIGGGAAATALSTGADLVASGGAGALALGARRGVPAIANMISGKRAADAAPHVAEALLSKSLPSAPEVPTSMLAEMLRERLVRQMMGGAISGGANAVASAQ